MSEPVIAAPAPADASKDVHDVPVTATDEERKVLAEFKGRVKDAMARCCPRWRSDSSLLRVLRARKMDVVAAETMYREIVNWRAEVGADTILDTYREPEVMRKYFPTGFHGFDRDGSPILVERVGAIDLKGMTESIGEEDFLRWVIFYHERQEALLSENSANRGHALDSFTVLADLQGASVRHLAPAVISIAQKRTKLEEAHYPEVAKRVFIIRAPRVFAAIYNLIKPMLAEGTREKIFVLAGDYQETLRKYISPEQIPRMFGGACDCHDAECRGKICPGGIVPATLRAGLPASSETVDVKNGESDVSILPVEPGTKVSWNFKVTSNDVNFFAFFAPASVSVESLNTTKLSAVPGTCAAIVSNSKLSSGSGEYVATAEGSVVLVWDNTFSWFHNKTVIKSVDLEEHKQVHAPDNTPDSTPAVLQSPDSTISGGAGASSP